MNNGQDLHSFRINRNIVECKEAHGFDNLSAQDCINRNIVECKVFLRWYLARSSRVLIETLWNVKEDTDVTMPVVLPRINRNIVECKVISLMFALGNCQSINRNIVECKDGFQNWSKSRCQVLIETLWNVKLIASCII